MARTPLPWMLVLACPACVAAATPATPASAPASEAAQRLDRLWARIEPVQPSLGSRSLLDFALEAAAADVQTQRVARALELAEQMQDRDPSSRTYGNFRWYWRAERPEDLNAVEFCMQKGVLVWMLHRDRLRGDAAARLERLIRFSVEGIRRHRVSESYTNIFLMKAWNCIAIGENTARADLAREGCEMLERWLLHTWENGIHEYLSPTYYGVDLESLGLIARHARDPMARANATAALHLLLLDITANWFVPCRRLGGAHSRDYDYLTGHGVLDRYLQVAGWLAADAPQAPTAFDSLCRWPMAARYKPDDRLAPRTVQQRWGAGPGQTATHYVGHSFSLGSSGAGYGPEDKVLALNLAGGPQMPMAYFLVDARGDPYGKKKFLTGGGHSKAHHATPLVVSVQRGPEVLLLACADPNSPAFRRYVPQLGCLLSHLVLPAAGDAWIGAEPARADAGERLDVPAGSPLFLRFRDVAVGVRLVAVQAPGEPAGALALVRDGRSFGAMRLTCTHAAEAPSRRAAVALWVRCAEGLDDAGFADFRERFSRPVEAKLDGDRVEVAADGLRGRMRLAADIAAGKRLAAEGAEKGTEDFLLAVNGRDVGREILESAEVVARYRRLLEAATSGGAGAPRAGETIEAEAAAMIVPPFRAEADPNASGGRFLWVPGEPGGKGSSAVARAVWIVHVPAGGTYRLEARVRTATPEDDSFFVRIAQAGREVVPRTDWNTGVHPRWQWVEVRVGRDPKPLAAELQRGPALLELSCREDGARVDALRLLPAAPPTTRK